MITRRSLLAASAALQAQQQPDVIVIGAGAFGVWTALHLLESGARVTLLDAYGPGNPRATSGDETRQIRKWLRLSRDVLALGFARHGSLEEATASPIGRLQMSPTATPEMNATQSVLRKVNVPYETLVPEEIQKRWPRRHWTLRTRSRNPESA